MAAEEAPLAVGEVYGLRVWMVSKQGRLLPVAHSRKGPWTPGVNHASCAAMDNKRPIEPERPSAPTNPALLSAQEKTALIFKIAPTLTRQPGVHQTVIVSHSDGVWSVSFDYTGVEVQRGPLFNGAEPDLGEVEQLLAEDYTRRLARWPDEFALWQTQYQAWQDEVVAYEAEAAVHQAPEEDCDCGFYLARDLDTINDYADPHRPKMIGIAKGYGRTIAYEHGWRVENVEIVAMAPWSPDMQAAAKSIERRHPAHSRIRRVMAIIAGAQDSCLTTCQVEDLPDGAVGAVRANYPDAEHYDTDAGLLAAWLPRIGET